MYHRVTQAERCQIAFFLQEGLSQSEIARRLIRNKSTVSREITRNRQGSYIAIAADEKARKRFKQCRRRIKFQGNLKSLIVDWLCRDFSPQQICKRLERELGIKISYQTIYRHLSKRNEPLKKYLRRFNKRGAGRYRQRRRLSSDDKLNIRNRPIEAELRKRIGDWERDTLYAGSQKQVLVCVDRKTRYIKIAKLNLVTADYVSKLTMDLLKSTGTEIHTITNDNGPEMRAGHKMPVPVYHCDPRRPQQRGTVENTIGLIRQYIKRNTELDSLSDVDLKEIENRINFRPRKCLDYLTAYEAFYGKTVALVL